MKPGMDEIGLDTTQTQKRNARRAWRATASILTDFAGNSNNLGDVILPVTTNAVWLVEDLAVPERVHGDGEKVWKCEKI
jgi:hypothetical protein